MISSVNVTKSAGNLMENILFCAVNEENQPVEQNQKWDLVLICWRTTELPEFKKNWKPKPNKVRNSYVFQQLVTQLFGFGYI